MVFEALYPFFQEHRRCGELETASKDQDGRRP
jgi:hypothetical protein